MVYIPGVARGEREFAEQIGDVVGWLLLMWRPGWAVTERRMGRRLHACMATETATMLTVNLAHSSTGK